MTGKRSGKAHLPHRCRLLIDPIDFMFQGLDVGVQVVARPWREHVALAAMAKIESAAKGLADYPLRPSS